jgi:ribonuclease E
MTRKKLGLGLIESFSENCEVCAGRGIIIHHDPVFKHRSPSGENPGGSTPAGGSSRSRRGRGGGQAAGASGVKNGLSGAVTHAITEDVKNALAQIAKSTVHLDEVPHAAEAAAPVADAAPVEILDIPVQKASRASRRVPAPEAESILDSVLGALPEPSAPGAGRGRRGSRRASTGGTVTPPASE